MTGIGNDASVATEARGGVLHAANLSCRLESSMSQHCYEALAGRYGAEVHGLGVAKTERYEQACGLVRSYDDLVAVLMDIGVRARRERVIWTEVTVDPMRYLRCFGDLAGVVSTLSEVATNANLVLGTPTIGLVVAIDSRYPDDVISALSAVAVEYHGYGVAGVAVVGGTGAIDAGAKRQPDGSGVGYRAVGDVLGAIEFARGMGVPVTWRAGVGGPGDLEQLADAGVRRVGGRARALRAPDALGVLAGTSLCVEVDVGELGNHRGKASGWTASALEEIVERGMPVSLCATDPLLDGRSLRTAYTEALESGVPRAVLEALAFVSLDESFMDAPTKYAALSAYHEALGPPGVP